MTTEDKVAFTISLNNWKIARRSNKDVTRGEEESFLKRVVDEYHTQCGVLPVSESYLGLRLRFYSVPPGWDPDNLAKPVMDALRNVIYKDDNQVVELHVKQFKGSGKPRIEVEVLTGEALDGWLRDYISDPELPTEEIACLLKDWAKKRFPSESDFRAWIETIQRERHRPL